MHAFADATRLLTRPLVLAPAALVLFALAFAAASAGRPAASAAPTPAPADAGPKLAHMVFFSLKNRAPESREKFVASCRKHLTGHDGVVFFEVGVIAGDVVEPVSVRDFDVSLHAVFESKEAEAKYLKHPRHLAFVDENKDAWSQVRVFDSYLTAAK